MAFNPDPLMGDGEDAFLMSPSTKEISTTDPSNTTFYRYLQTKRRLNDLLKAVRLVGLLAHEVL